MKNKFRVLPFRRREASAADPGPYQPIDSSRQQIRIIRLLPGRFDDAIEIQLAHVSLSGDAAPHYDALSYVWGQEQCPNPATVNGTPVSITSNLDTALRYFRDENDEKTLWVDAVCINQRDNVEKGPQVQMMGQIYRKAARVLVWLGPAAEGSDGLLEHMKEGITDENISDSALQNSSLAMMSRPWFTRIWVQQEIALAAEDPIMCCGRYTMSWATWCLYMLRFLFALENAFQEVMDRQEMEGVARQPLPTDSDEVVEEKYQKLMKHIENNRRSMAIHKALLTLENLASLRGGVEMSSGTYNDKMFEILAYVKARKPDRDSTLASGKFTAPITAEDVRQSCKDSGMDEKAMKDYIKKFVGRDDGDPTLFARLLHMVSHLDATDARDKIYGILGMTTFVGQPIQADYTKTKRRVYSEAMATIIRDSLHLSYTKFPIVDSNKRGLPSWVGDISGKILAGGKILPDYRDIEEALPSSRAEVPPTTFSEDYETLHVGGVELGRVTLVIEDPITEDPELADPEKRFALKDEVKSLVTEQKIEIRTLWRTLIGNCDNKLFRDHHVTWDEDQIGLLRSETKMMQAVATMCGQPHLVSQDDQEALNREDLRFIQLQLFDTCRKATLIFTDTGKLGVVMGKVAKGDVLAALFGVGMTFVLRRASSLSTFVRDFGKKERTSDPTYEMIGVCHVGEHELCHRYRGSDFKTFVIN